MRFLFLLVLLILPGNAFAYTVVNHDIAKPYEVMPIIIDPSNRQIITGELNGYPEMVEFTLEEEAALSVSIFSTATNTSPTLGGVIVRVLQLRGVEEVARLKFGDGSWSPVKEPVSKLTFLAGPEYFGTVASGTYRIEVNTPENYGKYLLVIGDNDNDAGYFATWRAVSDLYEFAEVFKLGMIRTSLVYIPLGIMLVLFGIVLTVRRTRPDLFLSKK